MMLLAQKRQHPTRGSEISSTTAKEVSKPSISLRRKGAPALTPLRTMSHLDPAPNGRSMMPTWLIKSSKGSRQSSAASNKSSSLHSS